jgi:hypothetical protein
MIRSLPDGSRVFDSLLGDIDAEIALISKAGAAAFEQRKYDQAREVLPNARRSWKLCATRWWPCARSGRRPFPPPSKRRPPGSPKRPKQDPASADIETSSASACVKRIEACAKTPLRRRSAKHYVGMDGEPAIACAVSKEYVTIPSILSIGSRSTPGTTNSCGVSRGATLRSGARLSNRSCSSPLQLSGNGYLSLNTTTRPDGKMYWHVQVFRRRGHLVLVRKSGYADVDLSEYRI